MKLRSSRNKSHTTVLKKNVQQYIIYSEYTVMASASPGQKILNLNLVIMVLQPSTQASRIFRPFYLNGTMSLAV